MVFIHGGGFQDGMGATHDGSLLAAWNDVVVVVMNYRLNVFGFLSTGDSVIPGNFGLWDQKLALEWVRDNIADFKGDNSKITIFGESAGGFSVGYQMLSPRNDRKLFQKAIAMSGTGFSLPHYMRKTLKMSEEYLKILNCSKSDVKCVRSKTTEELTAANTKMNKLMVDMAFYPVVDGDFLPYDPEELYLDFVMKGYQAVAAKIGDFNRYDYMTGFTSDELGDFGFAMPSEMFLEDMSENPYKMNLATNITEAYYLSEHDIHTSNSSEEKKISLARIRRGSKCVGD